MVNDRHARIAMNLISQSDGDLDSWKELPDESGFQSRFGNHYVQVTNGFNDKDEPEIRVIILKKDGTFVDAFNDDDLVGAVSDAYRELKQLLERIRRRATGVDQELDALLSNMDDIPF